MKQIMITIFTALAIGMPANSDDHCACNQKLSSGFEKEFELLIQQGSEESAFKRLRNLEWTGQPDILLALAVLMESDVGKPYFPSETERLSYIVQLYERSAMCKNEEARKRLAIAYERGELGLTQSISKAECLSLSDSSVANCIDTRD